MTEGNRPFFFLIGAIAVLGLFLVVGIWFVGFDRVSEMVEQGPQLILAEGDTVVIGTVQGFLVVWDKQAGDFIDLPLILPEDLPSETYAQRIIEELLVQPGIFPEGTQLRNLFVAEGTVYIDLNDAVRSEQLGATGEWIIIESLTRTLRTNFGDAVQTMVILIEGREVPSLAGRLACRVELL